MLVVLSLLFVAFALASVAPSNFKYRVSSEGITIEDHFFLWQELYDFYFKKREGIDVVHLRTHAFFPGELTITLGDTDREHVKNALLPYLPYREYIKPTFMKWQKESGIKGGFLNWQTQTELTAWAWGKGRQNAWLNCWNYQKYGTWDKKLWK